MGTDRFEPKSAVVGYIVAAGFGENCQIIKASKPHITFIKYNISINGLNLEKV